MLSADEIEMMLKVQSWDATVCAELVWLLSRIDDASAMAIFNLEPVSRLCGCTGGRRRVWGLASAEHLELHLSFRTYRSRAINHQTSPSLPLLLLLVFDRGFFAGNGCPVDHVSLRYICVEISQ
jgi:hypothetical protein